MWRLLPRFKIQNFFHKAANILFPTKIEISVVLLILSLFLLSILPNSKATTEDPLSPPTTPTPNPFNYVEDKTWRVDIFTNEQLATKPLEFTKLIYATKEGTTVSVFSRNLYNKAQTKIFEYEERAVTLDTGNYWTELEPSVDYSIVKNSLVYADASGLKIKNLSNGTVVSLITEVKAGTDESPPTWSIPALYDTYGFGSPKISSNGDLVFFTQGHFEGGTLGLINTNTKDYTDLNYLIYYLPDWSGTEGKISVPILFEGLKIYDLNQKLEVQDIASTLGIKEQILEANLSADDRIAVFTYDNGQEEPGTKLGYVNIEDANFREIKSEGNNKTPVFADNGITIYFIDSLTERATLYKFNVIERSLEKIAYLPPQFDEWKIEVGKDKLLYIKANTIRSTDNAAKVYILNPETSEVIYASPLFGHFTTFAGFAN